MMLLKKIITIFGRPFIKRFAPCCGTVVLSVPSVLSLTLVYCGQRAGCIKMKLWHGGRPPTSSSLRITDRSFRYASPCLWNQLPSSLRQPHFSPSVSVLPDNAPTTSSHSVNSPLSPSITPSLFHSRLKTYLFHKSFPP